MLVDIINRQIQTGLKVTLLIINNDLDQNLLNAIDSRTRIIRFNRQPGANPLLLLARLNMLISAKRPHVIHIHNNKLGRLVRLRRKRLLFTAHHMGAPMEYCGKLNISAITDAVADDIKARVPYARVTVVNNGIRTADILPRTDYTTPRLFRIIQVGRLVCAVKGQDILIRAVASLVRKGRQGIELSFIGAGEDEQMLRSLAEKEGIGDIVKFPGLKNREYIYSHLKNYHAMCHPSRSEGFGLTVAEAMAAGLPLLVTEGDGPWEVADHGRLCRSFPKDNVEACADAIEQLIDNYPESEACARQAREYVTRFDIANTVDAYTALYNSITAPY